MATLTETDLRIQIVIRDGPRLTVSAESVTADGAVVRRLDGLDVTERLTVGQRTALAAIVDAVARRLKDQWGIP